MTTHRRIALAAALALLAGGAWWLVRGPAIDKAVAPPLVADGDVAIGPPELRAQRDAAIAVATMPEDPWSLAESLAASAPAKDDEHAQEDCGQADAPQFDKSDTGDTDPVQTRGATPRYLAAQARIDAALRSSGDPLDRATADFINVGNLRTESGRQDALVQDAVGTSDPRVYALAYGLCQSMPPHPASCAALSAERWAQIDPGNGIPWVDVLGQAHARGDAAGVADAMAHLAASSRFDLRFFGPAGTVARHLPTDPHDLAAGADLVNRAISQAAALALPAFKPLIDVCRHQAGGDDQRAQQCVAISDSMYAHTDTMLPYAISGALLFQATGDESRRTLIKAERAVFEAHWSPATGLSRCGMARDAVRRVRREAEVGEVEAYREESRKFVTP